MKAFPKWLKELWGVTGAALAGGAVIAGCSKTPADEGSLENINKDWNRLIRASHIYPVYPLSQDVQPGDVFLTLKHIEDTSDWDEPGYLPFDQHLARLYPTGYVSFYTNSFGVGTAGSVPRNWIQGDNWSNAPAAAFPTYSFRIKQGGAGSVSLPIQGVPVGLSLMGAREASGMVTIADSHTYGVDELSLRKQVFDYLERHGEEMFKYISAEAAKSNGFFLQVVTRVYTTSRVAVSMFHENAVGGGASAGIAPQATVPLLDRTNAAENYSNLVGAVNATLRGNAAATMAPGGSLRFSHVSSRSVSLEETFPRPLVIGYVGFSVHITNAADFYGRHESRAAMFSIDSQHAYETLQGVSNYVSELKSADDRDLYSNALRNLNDIRTVDPAPGTIGQERDRAVQQLRHVAKLPLSLPARSSLTNAISELNNLPTFKPQVQIGPLPNARPKRKS